jgi:hypothetical protein
VRKGFFLLGTARGFPERSGNMCFCNLFCSRSFSLVAPRFNVE